LWDGVEGSSGSSGGGGPHDHVEYALVEHDHDEFTHDHDYLPLAGGTLTGGLTVDGKIKASNGSEAAPSLTFTNQPDMGLWRRNATDLAFSVSGHRVLGAAMTSGYEGVYAFENLFAQKDLQVDGNSDLKINVPADFWAKHNSGTVFHGAGMASGTQGSDAMSMTCNGYRNSNNKWTSLGVAGTVGATEIDLMPTGKFYVRTAPDHPTGSASNPTIRFRVDESGPTFRAMPSKTRTVDDVLERAETAEFPPEDVGGVATMDGHDEVPLFEVVSALLAKVKELSARIEELEGN